METLLGGLFSVTIPPRRTRRTPLLQLPLPSKEFGLISSRAVEMGFLSYRTGTKFAVKNTDRFAWHGGTQPVKTKAAGA